MIVDTYSYVFILITHDAGDLERTRLILQQRSLRLNEEDSTNYHMFMKELSDRIRGSAYHCEYCQDQDWFQRAERELDAVGGYIESGEGDPCDLFACFPYWSADTLLERAQESLTSWARDNEMERGAAEDEDFSDIGDWYSPVRFLEFQKEMVNLNWEVEDE